MRAALGLVGLLLVLAIVMLNARQAVQPPAVPVPPGAAGVEGASPSGDAASPRARTEAVGAQVQGLVDQAAQRASEAAAP